MASPASSKREDAVDVRADLSVGQQLHQRIIHARGFRGEFLRPGADKDADDGVIFQERQVHRDLWNLAAGEADRHQPSAPLHRSGYLLENRAADIVEADIDAVSRCDRLDPVAQVLAAIVDDIAGPVTPHQGGLVVGADTGDDAQAEMTPEVDGGESNPAGRARDQQCFAALSPCPLGQRVIGRAVIMQHRRPGFERDAIRQPHALRFLRNHPFGVAAGPGTAGHAIAGCEHRDLVADRDDDAGSFRAGHEGRRRPHLVEARDQQLVHEAHGRRVDVDEDLVAGRPRRSDLTEAQIRRASERIAQNRFHRGAPKMRGNSIGTRRR
ncbi:hypothetical protein ACVWXQ_003281 [Bradyrhizobium sp. S3.14.4]